MQRERVADGTNAPVTAQRTTIRAMRLESDPQREKTGEKDAGHDAGDEQLTDRLLDDDAVQDERDRRRNEDAERAARGDESAGEAARIAALAHLGNAHRADRRRC